MVDLDVVRLGIARHAATLFLANGVSKTSGKDIAAAAGVSERTVWRHFRTKEDCVEPLLSQSATRFIGRLRGWSRHITIEDHLTEVFSDDRVYAQEPEDSKLIVKLLAVLPEEPDLHCVWLMACRKGERGLVEVIADRLDRSADDFDVLLCGATVAAALRVVDETISLAAIKRGETFTLADVLSRMASAIRAASTLSFCDPQKPRTMPTNGAEFPPTT